MNTYSGIISCLKPNQVFVFGSNMNGFHGAGSAGYASFGVHGNHWRSREYHKKPDGWKGLWNVKGRAEGYQEGTAGRSYALPTVSTVKKPLLDNVVSENITRFYRFAESRPDLEFLVAYSARCSVYLNTRTPEEMAVLFLPENHNMEGFPPNVLFEKKFYDLMRGYSCDEFQ